MMLVQTLIFFIFINTVVESDPILFRRAYLKFVRNGKRENFTDVEHIDDKLIKDDKKLIIVRTKFLEVLYPGAVRNLKNLQDLYMLRCGIQRIEVGAFHNLPNLTVLHLQDNEIKEVKEGIFNNLTIQKLSLHRNQIRSIESKAFDNMPNLTKIRLNFNKLKIWDSSWFQNTPSLVEIYFRRNRINFLPENSFLNVQGPSVKLYLSKNKLGQINPSSFNGLNTISQLYLDRNNIQKVPEGAFRDLKEVDVIYLARNRISEINRSAFPKVRKIGILDLSSNLLECLPYELVTVANITNLEKNNGTCECVKDFTAKIKLEKRENEIVHDEESCPD